ncbi:MAG: ferrous iron transport protein B [Thermonemataceae bacterium]|nr:ferrous iron transport protein B [Thermonemataceae bacterium]
MKIALIGNPNSGKSSLFNQLTGLNQKVANFAGVTVEKKTGYFTLPSQEKVELTDLPGTYSLYPKSLDEQVVIDFLLSQQSKEAPDLILVVADAANLQRNLLLFDEIKDLGFGVILVLNMIDLAEQSGWEIDTEQLQKSLGVPVIATNARNGKGISSLKEAIQNFQKKELKQPKLKIFAGLEDLIQEVKNYTHTKNDYIAWLYLQHYERLHFFSEKDKDYLQKLQIQYRFKSLSMQTQETLERYSSLGNIVAESTLKHEKPRNPIWISQKIDKILMHKFWGFGIFILILLLMFDAIFQWAELPTTFIEEQTSALQEFTKNKLPNGWFAELLSDGIIAGIGSVLVFVPQIALLFGFIAILEESGYMIRAMIMMDKLMRRFGLNGKSVVPLISGVACAIPAIMATRNIDNRKERLITILVTPFISCSARLPIYTVMIALVIPQGSFLGFLSWQALALLSMYLLGILMALFASIILKKILHFQDNSYFVVEIPTYKIPRWKNVGITIWEKVKTFSIEAGKVIVVISIILWALASFGWGDSLEQAENKIRKNNPTLNEEQITPFVSAARLEASYAGMLGKFLEPAIEPLGFDWKIGIALVSSFAAREVFVSTMSVIYGLGTDDEQSVRKRMSQELNSSTQKPFYNLAVGLSLMVFYAFAMQCMSTFAIVYKETKSWKYPLLQLIAMNLLAYLFSLATYQILVNFV